jgi:hypothetical protein
MFEEEKDKTEIGGEQSSGLEGLTEKTGIGGATRRGGVC